MLIFPIKEDYVPEILRKFCGIVIEYEGKKINDSDRLKQILSDSKKEVRLSVKINLISNMTKDEIKKLFEETKTNDSQAIGMNDNDRKLSYNSPSSIPKSLNIPKNSNLSNYKIDNVHQINNAQVININSYAAESSLKKDNVIAGFKTANDKNTTNNSNSERSLKSSIRKVVNEADFENVDENDVGFNITIPNNSSSSVSYESDSQSNKETIENININHYEIINLLDECLDDNNNLALLEERKNPSNEFSKSYSHSKLNSKFKFLYGHAQAKSNTKISRNSNNNINDNIPNTYYKKRNKTTKNHNNNHNQNDDDAYDDDDNTNNTNNINDQLIYQDPNEFYNENYVPSELNNELNNEEISVLENEKEFPFNNKRPLPEFHRDILNDNIQKLIPTVNSFNILDCFEKYIDQSIYFKDFTGSILSFTSLLNKKQKIMFCCPRYMGMTLYLSAVVWFYKEKNANNKLLKNDKLQINKYLSCIPGNNNYKGNGVSSNNSNNNIVELGNINNLLSNDSTDIMKISKPYYHDYGFKKILYISFKMILNNFLNATVSYGLNKNSNNNNNNNRNLLESSFTSNLSTNQYYNFNDNVSEFLYNEISTFLFNLRSESNEINNSKFKLIDNNYNLFSIINELNKEKNVLIILEDIIDHIAISTFISKVNHLLIVTSKIPIRSLINNSLIYVVKNTDIKLELGFNSQDISQLVDLVITEQNQAHLECIKSHLIEKHIGNRSLYSIDKVFVSNPKYVIDSLNCIVNNILQGKKHNILQYTRSFFDYETLSSFVQLENDNDPDSYKSLDNNDNSLINFNANNIRYSLKKSYACKYLKECIHESFINDKIYTCLDGNPLLNKSFECKDPLLNRLIENNDVEEKASSSKFIIMDQQNRNPLKKYHKDPYNNKIYKQQISNNFYKYTTNKSKLSNGDFLVIKQSLLVQFLLSMGIVEETNVDFGNYIAEMDKYTSAYKISNYITKTNILPFFQLSIPTRFARDILSDMFIKNTYEHTFALNRAFQSLIEKKNSEKFENIIKESISNYLFEHTEIMDLSHLSELSFSKDLEAYFDKYIDKFKYYISREPKLRSDDKNNYADYVIVDSENKTHVIIELKYNRENQRKLVKEDNNNYSYSREAINQQIKEFNDLKKYTNKELKEKLKMKNHHGQISKYYQIMKDIDKDYTVKAVIITRYSYLGVCVCVVDESDLERI